MVTRKVNSFMPNERKVSEEEKDENVNPFGLSPANKIQNENEGLSIIAEISEIRAVQNIII